MQTIKILGTLTMAMALILMACGSIGRVISSITAAATAAAVNGSRTSAPGATPAPKGQIPNTGVNCAATAKANQDFDRALVPRVNLTPATDYANLTDPASRFYVDSSKLRGDLSTLARLHWSNRTIGASALSIDVVQQLWSPTGSRSPFCLSEIHGSSMTPHPILASLEGPQPKAMPLSAMDFAGCSAMKRASRARPSKENMQEHSLPSHKQCRPKPANEQIT